MPVHQLKGPWSGRNEAIRIQRPIELGTKNNMINRNKDSKPMLILQFDLALSIVFLLQAGIQATFNRC